MNPLVSDRTVEFLLHEVLEVESLTALPAFAHHDRATLDGFVQEARRLARERMFPAYRAIDERPPTLEAGRVRTHPRLRELVDPMVELGVIAASRPEAVGGAALPLTVATFAHVYLMAANLSAYGVLGLTSGAAHLVEAFGSDAVKELFLGRLLRGEWFGTMALTEPHAGSSLADVKTLATPSEAAPGVFRIRGDKTFISGGDHDLRENVVHLTLARIEGAPPGIRGVSLFAIPRLRPEGDASSVRLVDNDVSVTGLIHKIGWRGLPSVTLAFGDRGDCRGWLVGEPHRGIACMFQMMNEARIMVGLNGVATASVAYHEALAYARTRPQGRPVTAKDPATPQIPIVRHADVRRMLLRQKAIVEGGLALVAFTARFADWSEHAADAPERERCRLLLDLLTPIAKSFPAEHGFEANALALQVHGGYGYSSEYLPEAWLRDQKLNSIHEGTTGIQGLDLLGRKMVAGGGRAFGHLRAEVARAVEQASAAGVEGGAELLASLDALGGLTMELGAKGAAGDVDGMLLHSADYLELASIVVVAWVWLELAARAAPRAAEDPFYAGKVATARYWLRTELPRARALLEVIRGADDSYVAIPEEAF
jgi:alkylation response protein AidB-like acyl-CoA dehydrogenase